MRALLLTADLMVTSVAHGAAQRCGADVATIGRADALVDAAQNSPAQLVLIDLRTPSLSLETLLPRLREALPSDARIIAFGPHVHRDALLAAQAAGCDETITRGEFDRRIDGYLAS